jgi:hypothetical protein
MQAKSSDSIFSRHGRLSTDSAGNLAPTRTNVPVHPTVNPSDPQNRLAQFVFSPSNRSIYPAWFVRSVCQFVKILSGY